MEKRSILLEKRKLQNKLNRLKKTIQDLEKFRDHLNLMLAYAKRIKPTLKTTQKLQAFLQDLTTIFNTGYEFLEKERFIELYATEPKIQNEIRFIMDRVWNNFTKPLLNMREQASQDLKNVTK